MAGVGDNQVNIMIDLCKDQLQKAYCPYSKFPVGAVLVTESGEYFTGCNVENASFGLTICAERTAAVKAVSEGHRKFVSCFVITNSKSCIAPCGACRQFLAEFGIDMDIYLVGKDRKCSQYKLSDLLPVTFSSEELTRTVLESS